MNPLPAHILIIGSGVFGLSTALSLASRPRFTSSKITVVDRSTFPSPDGSSIDTSRIIRPDYHDPAYASLAAKAQEIWRQQGPDELGGQGRYTENGLMLVANRGEQGEEYVRGGLANARRLAKPGDKDGVEYLELRADIERIMGTGGGSGDWGYINRRSGWADAEACMRFLYRKVEDTNRVSFVVGTVESLLSSQPSETPHSKKRVSGVRLADNSTILADLVILATGAWTGKLIDLCGRAQATGQALCYMDITDEEQEWLKDIPTLLNMSTGMFIIPPRDNLLKVARHGYGYANPTLITHPEATSGNKAQIEVSVPRTKADDPNLWVPQEGEDACHDTLAEMIPSLAGRPFARSKICWYTDTPTADFIITYHPEYEGLFVATGGSGHGFKFLPVIGEEIANCLEGKCSDEFKVKWAWRETKVDCVVTEDGSRGGRTGMLLDEEFKREARVAGNRST